MKISARNQLPGTVTALREGAVNAELDIALVGGATVVAQVTMPSVAQLALKVGVPVVALVKSSWVVLACGEIEPKVSSRNRLRATVTAVVAGSVNSEIALRLAGGELMVATVTNESVAELGLVEGGTAWALFKASAVILAV